MNLRSIKTWERGAFLATLLSAVSYPLIGATLFTYDLNGNLTAQSSAESIPLLEAAGVVGNLTANQGGTLIYRVNVPASARYFTVHTNGGTGDGDLYIRRGGLATREMFDLASFSGTNTETISMWNVGAGTYYVMIRGNTAFQGLRLELSTIEPYRPDVAVGRTARSLKGIKRYGFSGRQKFKARPSGLRSAKAIAMVYNRGSVADTMTGWASSNTRFFKVTYRSGAGNVSSALKTALYRTPPRSYAKAPVKISMKVKPSRRLMKRARGSRRGLPNARFTAAIYVFSDSNRAMFDGAELRVKTK
jgi:hypothetical protein